MTQMTLTARGPQEVIDQPNENLSTHLSADLVRQRIRSVMCVVRNDLDALLDEIATGTQDEINPRRANSLKDAARHVWEKTPSYDEAEVALLRLEAAAFDKATRHEIVTIVATMLDARANFNAEKKSGYIRAMLAILMHENDVEPFSREALAIAAYQVMTKHKFLPEIPEVLEILRKEQRTFAAIAEDARSLLIARTAAEEILHKVGFLKEFRGQIPWS